MELREEAGLLSPTTSERFTLYTRTSDASGGHPFDGAVEIL